MCDNIWNIAPCGNIIMGEPAFLSEEFSNSSEPDLELVTTSGYGKNGALSVLQVSVIDYRMLEKLKRLNCNCM